MIMPGKYSSLIKAEAINLGFDACGISCAEILAEQSAHLKKWLEKGFQGEMSYMKNYFDKRTDPQKLVPGTKSIISVILNYNTALKQIDPDAPVISKYAYGKDYHKVMRKKLKQLLKFINKRIENVNARIFVDSAPVLDRAWAAKAGLGWIGKNSMLISPKFGSFVFVGSVFVDIELEYDTTINEMCGGCTKCLTSCPTTAIVRPKVVDGSKCISYFTIEFKGDLPKIYKEKFQNRIFGCDICQDVCPWNKRVLQHRIEEFEPKNELLDMTCSDWIHLDEEKYNNLFEGSALKRAKFSGLRRNLDFVIDTEKEPKV